VTATRREQVNARGAQKVGAAKRGSALLAHAEAQQVSQDVLQVPQGSLYPALHRLERRGWVKATWSTTENNRHAKYYKLSASGRQQLEVEETGWRKLAAAVAHVLKAT
jgi:transcriptional regulator